MLKSSCNRLFQAFLGCALLISSFVSISTEWWRGVCVSLARVRKAHVLAINTVEHLGKSKRVSRYALASFGFDQTQMVRKLSFFLVRFVRSLFRVVNTFDCLRKYLDSIPHSNYRCIRFSNLFISYIIIHNSPIFKSDLLLLSCHALIFFWSSKLRARRNLSLGRKEEKMRSQVERELHNLIFWNQPNGRDSEYVFLCNKPLLDVQQEAKTRPFVRILSLPVKRPSERIFIYLRVCLCTLAHSLA